MQFEEAGYMSRKTKKINGCSGCQDELSATRVTNHSEVKTANLFLQCAQTVSSNSCKNTVVGTFANGREWGKLYGR